MKKLLCLLGVAIALVSCTNDYDASCFKKDDPDPIPVIEPILLKKLVHVYPNGLTTSLESLYNGAKIVSDTDKSNNTLYTYTGDLITKVVKSDLSGNVYVSKEYFYNNGKLDYILSNELGNYYKTKFTYNNDGSIFYYKMLSDSSGNDGDSSISGRYVFANGNLVTYQAYNGSNEIVTTYEYDSKNNPRLNVVGLGTLIDMPQFFAVNNVVKKTATIKNGEKTSVETTTYVYEYDANGYPVKATQTWQSGDATATETSAFSY